MQQKTKMHTCAKIIVQDHLHWAHGSSPWHKKVLSTFNLCDRQKLDTAWKICKLVN